MEQILLIKFRFPDTEDNTAMLPKFSKVSYRRISVPFDFSSRKYGTNDKRSWRDNFSYRNFHFHLIFVPCYIWYFRRISEFSGDLRSFRFINSKFSAFAVEWQAPKMLGQLVCVGRLLWMLWTIINLKEDTSDFRLYIPVTVVKNIYRTV